MGDTATLAARLADLVGGPGNVRRVDVCATRLRFTVRDPGRVDVSGIQLTDGVSQVLRAGGQTQVVIGPEVEQVLRDLTTLPGWERHRLRGVVDEDVAPPGELAAGAADAPPGWLDQLFALLAGTFQPIIGPLVGASMIQMLLRLSEQFGWVDLDAPSSGVLVLLAASNAVFEFLPIFVAMSAARQLEVKPFLAGAIAAALLDPSFLALGSPGDVRDFFGAPLVVYSYTSAVLPPLLVAVALAWLEPRLRRIVPVNLRLVFVPTIALLVLVPLTALVFGPFGSLVGEQVAAGVSWLQGQAPVLLAVLVAGSFLFLVTLGLHWALVPVMLINLDAGGDPIIAAMGAYNFAVWGLAVGLVLRSRGDAQLRAVAGAGAAAGLLGGISEPMLYGVILRYRQVIPLVVGSAMVGGAVIGLFGVEATASALSSVFTIPLMQPVGGYVLGIGLSFALGLLGGVLVRLSSPTPMPGRPSPSADAASSGPRPVDRAAAMPESPGADLAVAHPTPRPGEHAAVVLGSPLAGRVVPLRDVPDEVFASGLMGAGVAVVLGGHAVVSPGAGEVVSVSASGHVTTVRLDSGVVLLVHVGMGTLQVPGHALRPCVVAGQRVEAGDVLVDVDLAALQAAGVALHSPVLVLDGAQPVTVDVVTSGEVAVGQPLLALHVGRGDTR